MKKAILALIGLIIMVLGGTIGYVLADPMGANVGVGTSERGNPSGTAGQVLAQAGNVTELSINGTSITRAWQGYFGNISGNISLEDTQGNKMYTWSPGSAKGEVYASRNTTMQWGNLNCSNQSYIAFEESTFGMGPADADNISATFSIANFHPSYVVGSQTINSSQDCYTAYTYVNNASQSSSYVFTQTILNDPLNRTVYVTLINDSSTGFDGIAHDFQLIVPEDGHTDAEAAILTTYYFWVELS